MTNGEAVCQEFSSEVFVSSRIFEEDDYTLIELEEIKCRVEIEYFTPLFERMVQVGYCCTQVQKDLRSASCTAWFEPMSMK
jgi:hypothetical protein